MTLPAGNFATTSSGRVEVVEVTKRYGALTAVDRVSLAVERGSFTTLLGPSGCGKTTLLRMIAGFLEPDDGDVRIDGRSQLGLPAFKRNAGMVFQDFALFPHLTVAQNVGYGLRFQQTGKVAQQAHVGEMLEFLQLESLAARFPHELSGGQQQRVALGRALAVRPQVLLMDEPLSNLDAKLRLRVRTELKSIQRQLNITTIYVTHDQQEALALSDTVAVMSAGRIRQIGAPRDLYGRPADRFVADVAGESNFLPVQNIERTAPGWTAELLGQRISVQAGHDHQLDQELVLLVRPEWLRVAAAGEMAAAGGALLAARLLERSYQGASEYYWFQLAAGQLVMVELPSVGAPALAVGDEAALLLEPGQAVLVRDQV